MRVIQSRNVHEALVHGLTLLQQQGIDRDSRNGPVKVMPCPVTTVYQKPNERVLFHPARDANPFFHLYEALWMLAGRNDIAPLTRYVKSIANFSDDGATLHGAYGIRWRNWFSENSFEQEPIDQLEKIAEILENNPDDRRCVLQMWDAEEDLGRGGKDFPCNTIASFQRQVDGSLDLTVFCRSNDIIWGAYGANAVHFSMLLEYMAFWIGCPVGKYYQVSVNWHGYRETFDPLAKALLELDPMVSYVPADDPYSLGTVRPEPLFAPDGIYQFDQKLQLLLWAIDEEKTVEDWKGCPFFQMCYDVLKAHEAYRKLKDSDRGSDRFAAAISALPTSNIDWVVAAREWISRRWAAWQQKQVGV
jgi:hypothetical protein